MQFPAEHRPSPIAFISEHASPTALLGGTDAGGQNVYVDEVSRNLADLGFAVDVFTRRDNATVPEVLDWAPGVRIIHLDAGPAEILPKDELWQYMPAFRDALLAFASRSGTAYGLVHGNFWMSGWVAAELRRILDIPAVQIFHATGKTKRRHQGNADTSPRDRIATEHAIIRDVDQLIAQCPAERDELIDDYGADPDKVVIIPSAVNTDVFQPVPRDEARSRINLEFQPDDLVVVYVGRLLMRKDPRNIVRAVAQLRKETDLPVKLMLVGGESPEPDPIATPEIGVLRALAAELGIRQHLYFAGKHQSDMLRYYYGAGDVAVTTPWYEPFGLTPLEAMACARPVIGSAVGGITFTIDDGVTGYLVPPHDPAALAARLRQLLTQPRLREQMGQQGRQRVEREFTWPTVAARTATLYEQLLQTHQQLLRR
jgi:D-inositol-3-phosphate glycosyltransferase